MVQPSKRTRSTKKTKVRTPGARTTTHYGSEKAKKASCGRCKKITTAVSTGTATEMSNMSKSSKVPNRAYAGQLCPSCVETLVRYVTRMEVKYGSEDFADLEMERDLTIEKYLPRGWFDQVKAGQITKKTEKKKPTKKAKPKTKKSEK